jgi:hypothetical protein
MSKLLKKEIERIYTEHGDYIKFLDNEEKKFLEDKAKIAKQVMESEDEAEIQEIAFDLFFVKQIYRNDITKIFHKLSCYVELYLQDTTFEPLSESITNLVQEFNSIIPKEIFKVNNDLEISENEKGFLDKVKKTVKENGELDKAMQQFKNIGLQKQ